MSTSNSIHPTIISGMLLALAGTFMFSLKPILVKQAYELNISSEQVIALRMIFAMPFYLAVVAFQWGKNKEKRSAYVSNLLPISMLGVLGYFIASYLDLLGLQYISAQLERVVLFCFPTIVVFMSFIFFKTQLPKNIWLILGMSYGGIVLIFTHDLNTLGSNVALGTALVFLSAIAFAIYVLWSKPLMGKVGSQMFTSIAMLAASVAIFIFFVATQDVSSLQVSMQAYLLVLCLAVFCTVVPSLLVAKAIHKIGPEKTSIVGTCGPVITSVLAVLLLGEAFTIYHGLGIGLIIFAVAIMMQNEKKSA